MNGQHIKAKVKRAGPRGYGLGAKAGVKVQVIEAGSVRVGPIRVRG